MQAIVSLLDPQHSRIVESLWAELNERFGIKGLYVTPFPHLSFQVASEYNGAEVATALRELARNARPIRVHTSGIGVFTGVRPVLYVPVVRTPELNELHRLIYESTRDAAVELSPHYLRERWSPHITLGQGEFDAHQLGSAVQAFGGRDFSWDFTLDNLALIYDNGDHQGIRFRAPFREISEPRPSHSR
jgi:2'-5' RNA ligase